MRSFCSILVGSLVACASGEPSSTRPRRSFEVPDGAGAGGDQLGDPASGDPAAGDPFSGGDQPPDARCADNGVEQIFASGAMVGCAGSVTWAMRDTLCGGGRTACTAAEWVSLRGGLAPTHNYWTADNLLYDGTSSSCSVSLSSGNECTNEPMRVCAGDPDPEGNECNWQNCGMDTVTPNEYFGGCSGNTTAGTICCL